MRIIGRHTDSKGRSTGERVEAIQRATPLTDDQHAAATRLLDRLLDACQEDGITLDDLDWVTDLPGACVDVTFAKARRGNR